MILIDMEMPETCDTCPLSFLRNMEWFCPFDRNRPMVMPMTRRKTNCMLRTAHIDAQKDRYGKAVLAIYEAGLAYNAIHHLLKLIEEGETDA